MIEAPGSTVGSASSPWMPGAPLRPPPAENDGADRAADSSEPPPEAAPESPAPPADHDLAEDGLAARDLAAHDLAAHEAAAPSEPSDRADTPDAAPSDDGAPRAPEPPASAPAARVDEPTPLPDSRFRIPPARTSEVPTPRPSYSAPASSSKRPSRPLLASEALMEDLAPVEPAKQHARVLCVVAGLLFALLGAAPLLGLHPLGRSALLPSLVVGAVTLFAAVARVTYRKRAVAMVALGAIVAGMGIAGTGPAQGIAEGGALWSLARAVAAGALPAAVLFRARYRAFSGARLLLAVAFAAALPFIARAVMLLVDAPTFGFAQVGAIGALALFATGLFGFMGSETTAAGSFVGPAMIAAFSIEAGLERLGALVPGPLAAALGVVEATGEDGEIARSATAALLSAPAVLDAAMTAVAMAASALLPALGLFQILAWKFAPAARMIDVYRATSDVPEERPSGEDWSTRA